MIPSLLDELKENRIRSKKVRIGTHPDLIATFYRTEGGWRIAIFESELGTKVKVNGKKVSWFFGWKIRKAIKKGYKHEQTKS